ncbi:MAG: hypothetical protein QOH21_616 [Acidobacteriota bacterium]|nr:hypothetical protein [Acidobacteriota bacterium]
MTAALLADEASFAIDAQPIVAAAKELGTNSRAVMAYVAAVTAIPMGPQPITIEGRVAGQYDPLAKHPGLKGSLYVAQDHARCMAGAVTTLHMWASGESGLIGPILETLESLRQMVDRMPEGVAVSTADLEKIHEHVARFSGYAFIVNLSMQQVHSGVQAYVSNVVADHDALTRGPDALEASIGQVEEQARNEALKYMDPLSAGIGRIIIKIAAGVITAARSTQAVISNALAGHEAIRGAANALATAAQSARTKQEKANDRVVSADAATISTTIRQARLATAITSWKQFDEFFKKSGI